MSDDRAILHNSEGGMYQHGIPFSSTEWARVSRRYEHEIQSHGSCSVRRLVHLTGISVGSARKSIKAYHDGYDVPIVSPRGHRSAGVGSLIGLSEEHHAFLYDLYKANPARPLIGYEQEMYSKYGFVVGYDLIYRWFNCVGPFRGSLRVTNAFPPDRESLTAVEKLRVYLDFVAHVNPTRLVFADEKPMKEKDIYRKVRRDPKTGETPKHTMNANGKNRYNILSAVTIKKSSGRGLCYFEDDDDGAYFFTFCASSH